MKSLFALISRNSHTNLALNTLFFFLRLDIASPVAYDNQPAAPSVPVSEPFGIAVMLIKSLRLMIVSLDRPKI